MVGTYWVNFHVGELVSGSAMIAMEECVGEGWPSHYRRSMGGTMYFGGAGWRESG